MYFGFDFYRNESIEDLDERIARINRFLGERGSVDTNHRIFGIFLLSPQGSSVTLHGSIPYLTRNQSLTDYRLCIEFFDDNSCEPKPELEIIYDLGKTPELYDSMQLDVSAVSYLCAYPDREEVNFVKSNNCISILFKFKDDDPNIQRIKKHLEVFIPNLSNKKN